MLSVGRMPRHHVAQSFVQRTLPLTISCAFFAAASHPGAMLIMNAPSELLHEVDVGLVQCALSCVTVQVYSR